MGNNPSKTSLPAAAKDSSKPIGLEHEIPNSTQSVGTPSPLCSPEVLTPSTPPPPPPPTPMSSTQAREAANELFHQGRLEAAVQGYSDAVASATTNREAAMSLSNRSHCRLLLGAPLLALEDAELAIQRDSSWFKGFYRRAATLERLGRLEEAVDAFELSFRHAKKANLPLDAEEMQRRLKDVESRLPPPCHVCGCREPLITLSACSHVPRVCGDCVASHIRTKVNDGLTDIFCPVLDCGSPIGFSEMEVLSEKETYDKHCEQLSLKALRDDSHFISCLNSKCGARLEVVDTSGGPILTCRFCRTKMCVDCQCIWHAGQRCEEYRELKRRQEEEKVSTEDFLKKECRRCPKCNVAGLKDAEGCAVITCNNCKFKYCWECLADYSVIFEKDCKFHNEGCPYRQ